MNVLMVAVGSYGDVLPMIGLGRALRSRGHAVTLFTNGHFANLVQQTGLKFVAMGSAEEYDEVANHPDLWQPHKGWRVIMKRMMEGTFLEEAYQLLCSHLIPGQTILISTTLGFAPRLVQETHQIPLVTIHLSPGVFHSAYQPPRLPNLPLPDWLPVRFKQGVWAALDHLVIDPILKPTLNRYRRELGLPPVSRIFHTWLHSPDLVLGLFPKWFAPPQPDWPPSTALTGFPLYDEASDSDLPTSIQDFLDIHPRPLVFTPGSANKHGSAFFAEAAKTCQTMNRAGIFLTRYPEQLPLSMPPQIAHFSYAPLSQLLPQCAALIHHGGIGTCSQALQAGIPQLIRPYAFDQFDNGARIEQLGVGKTLSKRSFRSPIIAQHLHHLLSSTNVATACHSLKHTFSASNPLTESCLLIERMLP
ncbi:MAG: glycosyltransferase [Nitrospirota bacterium]|nr:glycosyltransferase [Nitrospirota bacterium]